MTSSSHHCGHRPPSVPGSTRKLMFLDEIATPLVSHESVDEAAEKRPRRRHGRRGQSGSSLELELELELTTTSPTRRAIYTSGRRDRYHGSARRHGSDSLPQHLLAGPRVRVRRTGSAFTVPSLLLGSQSEESNSPCLSRAAPERFARRSPLTAWHRCCAALSSGRCAELCAGTDAERRATRAGTAVPDSASVSSSSSSPCSSSPSSAFSSPCSSPCSSSSSPSLSNSPLLRIHPLCGTPRSTAAASKLPRPAQARAARGTLRCGAPETPEGLNCEHNTLLHYAAWHGIADAVTPLCELGISACERNSHGDTALHLAARNRHWCVVQELLSAANANGSGRASPLNLPNRFGQTALADAYASGDERIVHALLEHGADPLHRDLFGDLPSERSLSRYH
mmetsp:Transcript_12342/g.31318  ORF Transcript_12342/g.31318 Transcript_12342/m.31318 type:complete len:396 (-) Transcript_12342:97-1284(-)